MTDMDVPEDAESRIAELGNVIEAEGQIDYTQLKKVDTEKAVQLESAFNTSEKLLLNSLRKIQRLEQSFDEDIMENLDNQVASNALEDIPELREYFNNLDQRFDELYRVLYIMSNLLEESIRFIGEVPTQVNTQQESVGPGPGVEEDIIEEQTDKETTNEIEDENDSNVMGGKLVED